MEKKTRAVTESGIYLTVVAAILIVANVLSFGVFRRVDVTRNERFTLSKGSGHLVSSLKKELRVKAYVTVGLAKLDAFVRDLDELMKEYERASGGKFKYEKIIAKSDKEKEEAKGYGLQEAAFGESAETSEDQASIAQGYMGIVFLYGEEKDAIPFLQPEKTTGLEFWISNQIRSIRDKGDENYRRIGLISGHDEIKLVEQNLLPKEGRGGMSMQAVLGRALPFYKFEDVDLKGGDAEINAELDALLITQPGKEFTDKELRRIDQFMMRKQKSLMVFASAVNLKASDPKLSATLNTWGLEKLLSGYGVDMKKDVVLDWQTGVRIPVPTQSGQIVSIRAPAILQSHSIPGLPEENQMVDSRWAGFFNLEELSFPFPSTLTINSSKQPEAKFRVVARTSMASWAESGDGPIELALKPNWQPKAPLEQRIIGVALETGDKGKLKSAFGGGAQDGIEIPAESAGENNVLVVSSAQFLANPFARAGNGTQMGGQMGMMMPPMGGDATLRQIGGSYAERFLTNTILGFKNTLDWATGDTDLIASSAKILGDPNLTYSDIDRPKLDANDDEKSIRAKDEEFRGRMKHVQNTVEIVLILAAPLLFAAFGIARWQMRERRRAAYRV
ncbi:MAG: Gldg family protein [Polyangiaceae bacterium]